MRNICCDYEGYVVTGEVRTYYRVVHGQIESIVKMFAYCPKCKRSIVLTSRGIGRLDINGNLEADQAFAVSDVEEMFKCV